MKPDRQSIISQLRAIQRMILQTPAGSGGEKLAAAIERALSSDLPTDSLVRQLAIDHEMLDGMDDECREAILHGWSQWRDRPGSRDVKAARQLHELRRVLAITITNRGVSTAQEVVYSEGDPLVRIEIQEGATLDQVLQAMGRAIGLFGVCWQRLIDRKTAGQVIPLDAVESPGKTPTGSDSRAV